MPLGVGLGTVAAGRRRAIPNPVVSTGGVNGDRLLLDGVEKTWYGIRVASASQTQALTDELIAALDDYAAHDVNMLSVYYEGSRGLNNGDVGVDELWENPSGDTVNIETGHQDRMRQICAAAGARGMVVVVGIFYQSASHGPLSSAEEVRNAIRAAAASVDGYHNVIVNIANEQNSGTYSGVLETAFDITDPARIIEGCQLVHAEDPDRLVGGGGYDDAKNVTIGNSADVDVLLPDGLGFFDDPGDDYDVFVAGGVTDKPIVNVELVGGATRLQSEGGEMTDVGVFTNGTDWREFFYGFVDSKTTRPGLSIHFHASNWTQVQGTAGENIHYELGAPGDGTSAAPGIRWWFEYVRDFG